MEDGRTASVQMELVPKLMPDVMVVMSRFGGVPVFYSLDLLQDHWQRLLAKEAHGFCTVVLRSGSYTTIRIPQGLLIAAAFLPNCHG